MKIKDPTITIEPVLTKEQIEYDDAIKNLKQITAKLKISQEGIDAQHLSKDKLETAIALFDQMDIIQKDFNIEAQKLQQDTNAKMMKLQDEANKKYGDVQNRYRELINSMKNTYEEEYNIKDIVISKEREEEIKKELADALAKAKEMGTNN